MQFVAFSWRNSARSESVSDLTSESGMWYETRSGFVQIVKFPATSDGHKAPTSRSIYRPCFCRRKSTSAGDPSTTPTSSKARYQYPSYVISFKCPESIRNSERYQGTGTGANSYTITSSLTSFLFSILFLLFITFIPLIPSLLLTLIDLDK